MIKLKLNWGADGRVWRGGGMSWRVGRKVTRTKTEYLCVHERETGGNMNIQTAESLNTWCQPSKATDTYKTSKEVRGGRVE